MIAVIRTGDHDRPEWLITINGIRNVRDPLMRDLGHIDIRKLDEAAVDNWARGYRVKGKKPGETKPPAAATLGNIDWALKHIWSEAAVARVVSHRDRPIINRSQNADEDAGTPRPFLDAESIRDIYRVMSANAWMEADKTGHRRLVRVYIALLATAGFRPGIELTRTLIGDVKFQTQEGVEVILIYVRKNAGKRKKDRVTTVYEGSVFPVRAWLKDLIDWRKAQGASIRDPLFACAGRGSLEQRMHRRLQQVLEAAGQLVDPMTGKERSGYSFRHYFATSLIDRGYSYPIIASWMGTSDAMIESHYNRYAMEKKAYQHAGSENERNQAIIERWQSEDTSGWAPVPDPRKIGRN